VVGFLVDDHRISFCCATVHGSIRWHSFLYAGIMVLLGRSRISSWTL
jgi:hypothetical protein